MQLACKGLQLDLHLGSSAMLSLCDNSLVFSLGVPEGLGFDIGSIPAQGMCSNGNYMKNKEQA